MYELSRQGIKYGIEWEACYNSATSYSQDEVVIAQGILQNRGRRSELELLFASNPKIPVVPKKMKQWILETLCFTSVGAGEILAVKFPSKAGRYGVVSK